MKEATHEDKYQLLTKLKSLYRDFKEKAITERYLHATLCTLRDSFSMFSSVTICLSNLLLDSWLSYTNEERLEMLKALITSVATERTRENEPDDDDYCRCNYESMYRNQLHRNAELEEEIEALKDSSSNPKRKD